MLAFDQMKEKNAELQRQVDELKERNYWLESEHEYQCEKSYFEGVEKGQERAVKDTAREIWNDITSYYFALRVLGNCTVELDKLAEFWHKRGVEVE